MQRSRRDDSGNRRAAAERVLATALTAVLAIACGGGDDPWPAPLDTCSVGPLVQAGLPLPSGTIEALSYNVAGLPDILSGSNPEVNTPLIGPLLNDYTLVLLQESWETPDPNPYEAQGLRTYHEILDGASTHLFQSVPEPAPVQMDPFRPTAILSDGLNRFAEAPFGPIRRDPWASCHETAADCLAIKGFSVSRHTIADNVYVDIYNLHMEAGGDLEDDAARSEGIDQLIAVLEARGDCMPVLLGGDFNLHTESNAVDGAQYQRLLDATGLRDVCEELACPLPDRIDKWLFRSGDGLTIAPLSWSQPTDVFQDGDGAPLSDHDPVAVEFQWSVVPIE